MASHKKLSEEEKNRRIQERAKAKAEKLEAKQLEKEKNKLTEEEKHAIYKANGLRLAEMNRVRLAKKRNEKIAEGWKPAPIRTKEDILKERKENMSKVGKVSRPGKKLPPPPKKTRQQMIDEIQIREILKVRHAKENLIDFIQYMMPEYVPNWHHTYICKKLQEWVFGDLHRFILNMGPQHGKSTISSIYLPAFILGHFPNSKVCIASYSSTLAQSFCRQIQEVMRSKEYMELFPDTRIPYKLEAGSKVTSTEFELSAPHRGGVLTASVGSSLTGRSVDFGIIDDCYKSYEEANSPTISDKTWSWFNNVFMSRLRDPGVGTGKVLQLFTRWSEDDIAGRLLKDYAHQWELVKLPTLADQRYLDNIDGNKPDEDPRTEVDEPLWPAFHGKEKLIQVRDQASMIFSCLYQQEPGNFEGNILRREWFKIVDWGDIGQAGIKWDAFVDPAYTSSTINDPSAVGVFGFDGSYLYVRAIRTVHMELPDLVRFIEDFAMQNGCTQTSKIYVEPKASGLSVIQAMNAQTNLSVVPFKWGKVNGTRLGDKDKVTRVFAIQGKIEGERVRLIKGSWNEGFMHEVTSFPNSRRDDQVDILSFAVFQNLFKKKARSIRIV